MYIQTYTLINHQIPVEILNITERKYSFHSNKLRLRSSLGNRVSMKRIKISLYVRFIMIKSQHLPYENCSKISPFEKSL